MGLFKSIGKGLKQANDWIGKTAKKAVSNPIVTGALGLAAGIALPGLGSAIAGGIGSVVNKVGDKIKGGKMNSALDGVLDGIESQANQAATGFLGIGDTKKGFLGLFTGANKAKKEFAAGAAEGAATVGADPDNVELVYPGAAPSAEPAKSMGLGALLVGALTLGLVSGKIKL